MVVASPQLGFGLYTPREAALYARVRTATVNRWVFGNATGEPVIRAEIGNADEKVVTFQDFVQTLGIRAIRTQYSSVSLQKIRKAVLEAQDRYGIEHPLAAPHRTFVIQEGSAAGEIVIRIDKNLVQVTGAHRDQTLIGPIAELYLSDVIFEDDRATRYRAWNGGAGSIIMDPHQRFGEPIVEQCGYSASTLWEANIVEGGIHAAAEAYGVEPEQVELAVSYYDHLMSVAT